jgi:hypothetical protein
VVVIGRSKAESAGKKDLSGRGAQQIQTTHHFTDPHLGIIDDDCQLVSRHVITAPDNEVSKIVSRDEFLRSLAEIVKTNHLAFENAKAPIHSGRRFRVG